MRRHLSHLAPGKYYVLASSAPIDRRPESIARLYRARIRAREVEIGAKATVVRTLQPTVVD